MRKESPQRRIRGYTEGNAERQKENAQRLRSDGLKNGATDVRKDHQRTVKRRLTREWRDSTRMVRNSQGEKVKKR